MIGYVARTLLKHDRPLTIDELFPAEGVYSKSAGKTWKKGILEGLIRTDAISMRKRNGIEYYEPKKVETLLDLTRTCPPDIQESEDAPVRAIHYDAKEWAKYSRVIISINALKRLLASNKSTTAARFQPRLTLFLAKKGNKFQQKQIADVSWQKALLDKLVEHKYIFEEVQNNITVYNIIDESAVRGIVDGTHNPCIHTLLWPDVPCTINHAAGQEEDEDTPQEEESAPPVTVKEEDLVEKEVKSKSEEPNLIVEAVAEDKEDKRISKKELSTDEILHGLTELVTNLIEATTVQGRVHDKTLEFLKKMFSEIEHLHSKLDKLHDENVHLRKEHKEIIEDIAMVHEKVETLVVAFDPNESSLGAIKKRLGELEKLASEHKELLDNNGKYIKTSLAEAATSMVNAAAKAFIQADHSEVLTKMNSMEETVVDAQSRTSKVLESVYDALNKVRVEYEKNSRVPVIIDRMTTIATELKVLQQQMVEASQSGA